MSQVKVVQDEVSKVESYVVDHKGYVEAWISLHVWIWMVVFFVVGWSFCAIYHHVYPSH